MIRTNELNQDSLCRINNIERGFRLHPQFSKYSIKSFLFNHQLGAYALEISLDGYLVNLWTFYPGICGEIESIAVYGSFLEGHKRAIERTMKVFDMNVVSVDIDSDGMTPFLDIILESY